MLVGDHQLSWFSISEERHGLLIGCSCALNTCKLYAGVPNSRGNDISSYTCALALNPETLTIEVLSWQIEDQPTRNRVQVRNAVNASSLSDSQI